MISLQISLANNFIIDFQESNSLTKLYTEVEHNTVYGDFTNNNLFNLNIPLVNNIGFIDYPFTNGSSCVLDKGNISLDSTNGLSFNQISFSSATGSYSGGILIYLNETYLISSETNLSIFNHYIATNKKQQVILIYDDSFIYQVSATTGSEINDGYTVFDFSPKDGSIFNMVYIGGLPATASSDITNNIYFLELNNVNQVSNNNLPLYNITYDDTICVDKDNFNNVQFNFTINSTDLEGDIIYYAIQQLFNKNFNRSINFNTQKCFLFICSDYPDYDFTKNVYDSNTCKIDTSDFYNSSKFNVLDINNEYMLNLNSVCVGDNKNFYYNLEESLTNLFFYTEIYNLDTVGENFNLSFYNSQFNKVSIIRINLTDTNYSVYEYNGTNFNFKYEYPNYNTLQLIFNNYPTSDNQSYLLLPFQLNGLINLSMLGNNSIRYFGIELGANTDISLKEFIYSGIYQNPLWTSSKPNNITLSYLGLNYIDFYISDSINYLSNKYNKEKISINIIPQEYCLGNYDLGEENENLFGEYQNTKGLTGVKLLLSKFLWFIQFPYRFAKYFNLLIEIYAGIILLLIFLGYKTFSKLNESGNQNPLKNTIYVEFFTSIIFMLMKVMYIPLFIFIGALASINLAIDLFRED